MGKVKQVLVWVVVSLLSVVTSTMVLLGMLWRRWKVGEQFFYVKPRPTPPAILNDPKWGTHCYIDLKSQGIKLHYVEGGEHSKPLMLFVHGFPECWFSWRHQLEHFSKKFWVVAVDLRGYGDSDKPAGKRHYKRSTLVEDLRCFVVALEREDCILVGHDWGAALAWSLVIKHPHMFKAHVSCNGPHPEALRKCFRQSPKQLLMSWYMYFFQMPWLPEILIRTQDLNSIESMFRGPNKNSEAFPDEVIEAYKYYFSQKGAFTPPINYYRNIDFSDSEEFPKVKVPSLVIWGTEDMALSSDLAVMNAVECESAEVKLIEGASHWVQQDQPQAVNIHIEQFLERTLK